MRRCAWGVVLGALIWSAPLCAREERPNRAEVPASPLVSLPRLSQNAFSPPDQAVEVDLALVLAVDISYSMDLEELNLQRNGYIEAIISKPVLDAIKNGMLGKIALTYLEWAGNTSQYVIADWTVIDGEASARAFAQTLQDAPIRRARRTSITGALEFSFARLQAAPFRPLRRVIDLSGDGPNNEGGLITKARDEVVRAGVTINGLPIIVPRSFVSSYDIDGLDAYYRDCVIGGPGSFMVVIRARAQFSDAIKSKILREVAQAGGSDADASPQRSSRTDCQVGERMWRQNWERN